MEMQSVPEELQLFNRVLPLHSSIVADIQSFDESAEISHLQAAVLLEKLSETYTSLLLFCTALAETTSTDMITSSEKPSAITVLSLI